MLDFTHEAGLQSWVESANAPRHGFPIQNLPLGVFATGASAPGRIGVAIGDRVLDLGAAAEAGLLEGLQKKLQSACRASTLNALMGLGPGHALGLRQRLAALLKAGAPERERVAPLLRAQSTVRMLMPAAVGDYTDFYASIQHATNVGRLFRPDTPLLPNYKYVPVGYHGRSSSLIVSGEPVVRPSGQRPAATADGVPPDFGPTRQLDYELEVGFFVGQGNARGEPIAIHEAGRNLFGVCLLNDWSARDLQRWEYQPLGPFLGKNFATTISPWVVTAAALAPFRCPVAERPAGDPAPLAYLNDAGDQAHGALDIALEVGLATRAMREQDLDGVVVGRGNLRELYWSPAQLLTHHAGNGCNLRPGDLLGSGTVSGESAAARGCLLELTRKGQEPLALPSGETRTFLEDGDEVTLRGWCERAGFRRIGLGECRGVIVNRGPAPSPSR